VSRSSAAFSSSLEVLEKQLIKPWEDIRDYFGQLSRLGASFEAMTNLVREIELSRYKEGYSVGLQA